MVCMHRGMLEPRWSGHLTELNKTNVSRQNKDKGVKTESGREGAKSEKGSNIVQTFNVALFFSAPSFDSAKL